MVGSETLECQSSQPFRSRDSFGDQAADLFFHGDTPDSGSPPETLVNIGIYFSSTQSRHARTSTLEIYTEDASTRQHCHFGLRGR